MPRFLSVSALLLACWVLLPTVQAQPRLLHSEPSQFGELMVFEDNGERCMNFNTMEDLGRHTCMSLADPHALVFDYTRMMISALYVNPDPKRILVVGLGGASLQQTLERLLPDAVIDTVEIDPAVGRVAQAYFGYRPGPRQRLYIDDGRAFVEQAHREGRQYDIVMLDAFDVDYIPEHLMTLEFLQHVKGILSPGGVVVSNTFTRSQMYARESATYGAVFGPFYNLRHANRVIVAARGPLPSLDDIAANAKSLQARLEAASVYEPGAIDRYTPAIEGPADAELLRDPASTSATAPASSP